MAGKGISRLNTRFFNASRVRTAAPRAPLVCGAAFRVCKGIFRALYSPVFLATPPVMTTYEKMGLRAWDVMATKTLTHKPGLAIDNRHKSKFLSLHAVRSKTNPDRTCVLRIAEIRP